jgi:hypothetical protein
MLKNNPAPQLIRSQLPTRLCKWLKGYHFPTTDGRELIFPRYTQPEKDQLMLLTQLKLKLPAQSPPRITAKGAMLKS